MATKEGYKPNREFSANYKDKSTGNAGADAIEKDIDKITSMFDPNKTIIDPITEEVFEGGIGSNNMQDGGTTLSKLESITLNDSSTADPASGDLLVKDTLDMLATMIKKITGKANYYIDPVETLESLNGRADGIIDTTYTKTELDGGQLDNRYYTESEVDAIKSNLEGVNRSTQTIKDNYDRIISNDSDISDLDTRVSSNDSDITNLQSNKADKSTTYLKTEIDAKDDDIKGLGRTTETLKGNANNIENHKADTSNPHEVTANQVGAYSKTEMQTSGSSNVHWGNLTNVPNLADNSWKPAVSHYNNLPVTGNNANDMRVVADDGDGKTAMYRCYSAVDSEPIANQWEKLADLDWTNDHGALVGLGDDDHTQYLRTDGTRMPTGDLNIGGFKITNFLINPSATPPASTESMIWYDTNEKKLKIHDGTSWINVSGQGAINRRVEITATEGQTIFDVGQNGSYAYTPEDNTMSVYVKNNEGYYVLLDEDEYIETDNETITLLSPATAGSEFNFRWQYNLATILDAISDDAITNRKLATSIKIGTLLDLSTNYKDDIVGAINELKTEADTLGAKALRNDETGTLNGNLNILNPTLSELGLYEGAVGYGAILRYQAGINKFQLIGIDNNVEVIGLEQDRSVTTNGLTYKGKKIWHEDNLTPAEIGALASDGTAVNSQKLGGKTADNSLVTTEKTDLVGAINELFTNVSNGKDAIASAITDMNQTASGANTFVELSNAIRNISDDANALSSRILSGSTAYVNGSKITGSMANNGNVGTITPKTYNQSIPSGYTSGGTVLGDSDLTASNIRSGRNIFGVSGSLQPADIMSGRGRDGDVVPISFVPDFIFSHSVIATGEWVVNCDFSYGGQNYVGKADASSYGDPTSVFYSGGNLNIYNDNISDVLYVAIKV